MKTPLIIVCPAQFGYLIDTYYYSIYLKNDFDIKYICIDENHPRINEPGVELSLIHI